MPTKTPQEISDLIKRIPAKYDHPLFGVVIALCDRVAENERKLNTLGNAFAAMIKSARSKGTAPSSNGHKQPAPSTPEAPEAVQGSEDESHAHSLDHLQGAALNNAFDNVPDDPDRAARIQGGKEHGQ